MKKNSYFPLFIDMKGKKTIIFGGGQVASRRAAVLLNFQADVKVVAEQMSERLWELNEKYENLTLVLQSYETYGFELELRHGSIPFYVIAATNLDWLNHDITDCCKQYHILVTNAGASEECSVYFPAVVQDEELTIGIVSEKKEHAKVKAFKAKLIDMLRRKL